MSGVIGGLIAIFLIAYVSRRAAFAAVPGQLCYGWFLKGLGWLMVAATAGLAYVMVFTDHRGQYVALSILILVFGAPSGPLLVEAYGTSGSFDSEGIVLRTAWTGSKHQRWVDLVTARFNPLFSWYSLAFKDGTTIRLSNILNGYGAALKEIERHGIRVLDQQDRSRRS